ncbi:hypothetical protein BH11VER1_BH11VER1_09640 [soil metagenome]
MEKLDKAVGFAAYRVFVTRRTETEPTIGQLAHEKNRHIYFSLGTRNHAD